MSHPIPTRLQSDETKVPGCGHLVNCKPSTRLVLHTDLLSCMTHVENQYSAEYCRDVRLVLLIEAKVLLVLLHGARYEPLGIENCFLNP